MTPHATSCRAQGVAGCSCPGFQPSDVISVLRGEVCLVLFLCALWEREEDLGSSMVLLLRVGCRCLVLAHVIKLHVG